MFENYQNLDTRYTPNNLNVYATQNDNLQNSVTNKPFELLDRFGNLLGYFWYYGNSVVLSFEISGEGVFEDSMSYVDVGDILSGCKLTLSIYDHKYTIVHQETIDEVSGNCVDFVLDSSVSKKLLKGKYTMSLVASSLSGYNETLFSTNDCILEVR